MSECSHLSFNNSIYVISHVLLLTAVMLSFPPQSYPLTSVCTYVHTYMHTYVHTCGHKHIHTYLLTYINTLYVQANEMERPQFQGTHLENLEGAISKKHSTDLGSLSSRSAVGTGVGSTGSKEKDDNEYRKAYPVWRRLIR